MLSSAAWEDRGSQAMSQQIVQRLALPETACTCTTSRSTNGRVRGLPFVVLLVGCAPEVSLGVDLHHAEGRAVRQTDPETIPVLTTDSPEPYYVLADLEVVIRQRSALGDVPTKELAVRALREQAGRIGAQAVVLTAFGEQGMSFWSYDELRGHGRAVRFR